MSDHDRQQNFVRAAKLLTLAATALGLVVFYWKPESPSATRASSAFDPYSSDAKASPDRTARSAPHEIDPRREPTSPTNGSSLDRRKTQPDAQKAAEVPPAHPTRVSATTTPSAERGTKRTPSMVGPLTWMAELPERERAAIAQELDTPPTKPFPLDLQIRRRSIDMTREVVFDCFDALKQRQPQSTGRMIVAFNLVASEGRAQVLEPSIPTQLNLDDPPFTHCILKGLESIEFASEDEGRMRVEYPFLFDLEPTP